MQTGTSPLHGARWRKPGRAAQAAPLLLASTSLDDLRVLLGAEGFAAFLTQVRTDLCAAADGIARAGEAADLAGLRRHSHALIGVAGAIGATSVEAGARALNAAARAADAEAARDQAGALCHLARTLCDEIARHREGARPL